MALATVPNTAELVFGFELWGQQVCITRHVSKDTSSPWTTVELQAVIDTVTATWRTSVFNHLGGNLHWRAVTATDISVVGGAQVIDNSHAGEGGSTSGETYPGNVAFAITLRTGHTGRAFRGRNFLPGISTSQVSGNEVTSLFAEQVRAGENAWAAAVTAAGYTWTIVSRSLNNAPRPTPVALPVTSVGYADLSLDSQRRRLNKRGS